MDGAGCNSNGDMTFCHSGDGSCGGSLGIVGSSSVWVWQQQWPPNFLFLEIQEMDPQDLRSFVSVLCNML